MKPSLYRLIVAAAAFLTLTFASFETAIAGPLPSSQAVVDMLDEEDDEKENSTSKEDKSEQSDEARTRSLPIDESAPKDVMYAREIAEYIKTFYIT